MLNTQRASMTTATSKVARLQSEVLTRLNQRNAHQRAMRNIQGQSLVAALKVLVLHDRKITRKQLELDRLINRKW
jgi:hypothetical protein